MILEMGYVVQNVSSTSNSPAPWSINAWLQILSKCTSRNTRGVPMIIEPIAKPLRVLFRVKCIPSVISPLRHLKTSGVQFKKKKRNDICLCHVSVFDGTICHPYVSKGFDQTHCRCATSHKLSTV